MEDRPGQPDKAICHWVTLTHTLSLSYALQEVIVKYKVQECHCNAGPKPAATWRANPGRLVGL